MKIFRMADVEKIEEMLAAGDVNVETVKFVRWDGLVFTTGGCIYTGLDKLIEIREVA